MVAVNLIAFKTIVIKEIRRFMRIWVQTIVPPAVSAVLYMMIFGTLIGSRVGEMDGHSYIDFIVPGIIMMAVITNSYGNSVSSFFGAKFQNHLDELLIAPVFNWVILLGFVVGGVCRGLAVGSLVAVVSLFFTSFTVENPLITFLVVVLTSMLFSIGGVINSIYAKGFDDISIIPNFVLTPLTYLGGIFYSIKLLPDFWQGLSFINPVLYMINGFRFGILGRSDIDIGLSFLVIAVFIILLATIALYLLNKGVGIKS
ncbi:ABC transporter permease [Chromatiales bacterium (ex Bugula neritina AB1)]|nr:ABC transporter permease [Chromatiales bacterium (ex Bugula neritina AB1)]